MSLISHIRWLGLIALASLALAIPIAGSGGGGAPAQASPGGLDRAGGHHCWTACKRYGLRRGDYHCHRGTKKCRKANRRHARHGH